MITCEGLEKLRKEHDHFGRVERPDVTAKITWTVSWEIAQKMPITITTKSIFDKLIIAFGTCVSVLMTLRL